MTVASAEAKAYKERVRWMAMAAGVKLLDGPVEYELDLYPQRPQDYAKRAQRDPQWWDLSVRCIDLDNARKVLLDALNGIAWDDDSMIRKDAGQIMVPDGEARVVIRVKPYQRVTAQMGLPMGEAA